MCTVCGLYLASKKSVKNHIKLVHKDDKNSTMVCSRVIPAHIAKYRNREALCILEDDFGCESVWINIEDIDNSETADSSFASNEESEETSLPLIKNVNDWQLSPWSKE